MTKIIGFPIKIYDQCMVYIPQSYWEYYGIDPDQDRVIRVDEACKVLLLPFEERWLQSNETVRKVHIGKIHIDPTWVAAHGLQPGDNLWLIGNEKGLVLSARQLKIEV